MKFWNFSKFEFAVSPHPVGLAGPFYVTFELANKTQGPLQIQSVGWESKKEDGFTVFSGETLTIPAGEKRALKIPQSEVAKILDEAKNLVALTADGGRYTCKPRPEDLWKFKITPVACQMPVHPPEP